jgi:hypothetical protein
MEQALTMNGHIVRPSLHYKNKETGRLIDIKEYDTLELLNAEINSYLYHCTEGWQLVIHFNEEVEGV